MAQTALNGELAVTDSWQIMSEVNCTFVVLNGTIYLRGDTALPTIDKKGVPYTAGQGEGFETATLARFSGATALYIRSPGSRAEVYVNRAAVA